MSLHIIYAHKDRHAAQVIAQQLALAGYRVPMHPLTSQAHHWQRDLYALIQPADKVLWLNSAAAQQSDWCRWELAAAAALNKPVVVWQLADIDLPPGVYQALDAQYLAQTTGKQPLDKGVQAKTQALIALLDVYAAPLADNAITPPHHATGTPARAVQPESGVMLADLAQSTLDVDPLPYVAVDYREAEEIRARIAHNKRVRQQAGQWRRARNVMFVALMVMVVATAYSWYHNETTPDDTTSETRRYHVPTRRAASGTITSEATRIPRETNTMHYRSFQSGNTTADAIVIGVDALLSDYIETLLGDFHETTGVDMALYVYGSQLTQPVAQDVLTASTRDMMVWYGNNDIHLMTRTTFDPQFNITIALPDDEQMILPVQVGGFGHYYTAASIYDSDMMVQGIIALHKGAYDTARLYLGRIQHRYDWAGYYTAMTFFENDEYESAIAAFENTLRFDTLSPQQRARVYLNMGLAYLQSGQVDAANQAFYDGRRTGQLLGEAWYYTGVLQESQGEIAAANTSYAFALQFNDAPAIINASLNSDNGQPAAVSGKQMQFIVTPAR